MVINTRNGQRVRSCDQFSQFQTRKGDLTAELPGWSDDGADITAESKIVQNQMI